MFEIAVNTFDLLFVSKVKSLANHNEVLLHSLKGTVAQTTCSVLKMWSHNVVCNRNPCDQDCEGEGFTQTDFASG